MGTEPSLWALWENPGGASPGPVASTQTGPRASPGRKRRDFKSPSRPVLPATRHVQPGAVPTQTMSGGNKRINPPAEDVPQRKERHHRQGPSPCERRMRRQKLLSSVSDEVHLLPDTWSFSYPPSRKADSNPGSRP